MPAQPPSVNPFLVPADTASFFRGFVERQDEVPAMFRQKNHDAAATTKVLTELPPLIQTRVSDSGLYCTSVFLPHELHPRKGEITGMKGGPADWMFGVFSLCLLLLVFIRVIFHRRLEQIFNAFFRPRHLSFLIRDGNVLKERITPPMILLHILSFSLFFFLLIDRLEPGNKVTSGGIMTFLMLSGSYGLFYGIRALTVWILGWVFDTRESTTSYLTNSSVMDEVLGIFLLPFSLVLIVSNTTESRMVLTAGIALFALILLYRLIRNFIVGLSNVKFSWVYLFLYLCTIEILPVLVIGKLINDWFLA